MRTGRPSCWSMRSMATLTQSRPFGNGGAAIVSTGGRTLFDASSATSGLGLCSSVGPQSGGTPDSRPQAGGEMRRVVMLVVAAVSVLALTAVAIAQTTQENTYNVQGSVTPKNKPGSTSKPVPVAVKFTYQVGEK